MAPHPDEDEEAGEVAVAFSKAKNQKAAIQIAAFLMRCAV